MPIMSKVATSNTLRLRSLADRLASRELSWLTARAAHTALVR